MGKKLCPTFERLDIDKMQTGVRWLPEMDDPPHANVAETYFLARRSLLVTVLGFPCGKSG